MPDVSLSYDESYPVFFITSSDDPDYTVHMTQKEVNRIMRASDEWEAVQAMMRERCDWR